MAAALTAGLVSAQFVAGKAVRDALYLANLDLTSLPAMVAASALFSMAVVGLSSKVTRRTAPGRLIPALFAASAVLLLTASVALAAAPQTTAVGVYLLISGVGPMLGSGFWLIVTEGFDPRSARQYFGRITAAGTIGGLVGGLVAERVADLAGLTATLPVLAALNLLSAWYVHTLARRFRASIATTTSADDSADQQPAESGVHVLARAPYLRSLVFLVLLGSGSVVLVDFVFKAQAVSTFGNGDDLLRFFGVYYGVVSLLTFVVQASSSRAVLERFGLGVAAAAPSIALVAGGTAAIAYPGLVATLVARGGESVFRGSLFRAGYELYFTAVSTAEKRAAKSLIDVVIDRVGEASGAGLVRLVLVFQPAGTSLLLGFAVACAAAALAVAARLNRGYIGTLEQNLRHRAADLDLSQVGDRTTRSVLLTAHTLPGPVVHGRRETDRDGAGRHGPSSKPPREPLESALDDELRRAVELRSGDAERVRAALRDDAAPLTGPLVAHAIPLLAWDLVADDAGRALRAVADRYVGTLVDALVAPDQDFAVRRRLARVFSTCSSQRAFDGLMLGLADPRFEVRFQCARSLATLSRRDQDLRVDRAQVMQTVLRETTVGRLVWESQRLLADAETTDDETPFLDQFVRDRASRSLAHVFTLLSLVLPAVPLQVAFRGLHTDDRRLRGTALEYLEGVLPPEIRAGLWPYLEDSRTSASSSRSRDDVVADLLRSHESIVMNLEELRRRAGRDDDTPGGNGRPDTDT